MKKALFLLCILAFVSQAYSQEYLLEKDYPTAEPAPLLRMKYFHDQRAYPDKDIPHGARVKAINQMKAMMFNKNRYALTLAQQPEWKCIGPFDVGGRIKSIVVHPTEKGHIYAAGAAGGIWESKDFGDNWTPIFDNENAISFGALAIDNNNPSVLFAGTGEAVIGGGNVFLGSGMYKTTDGGQTWGITGLTDVGAFSKVFVHPKNSDLIIAGAVMRNGGFYKSTDGGQTWMNLYEGNVTDVTINPDDENEYFIGVYTDGIYHTTDGGLTWEKTSEGIEPDQVRRISVQAAPSSPNIVYALYDIVIGSSYDAKIYKTTDSGQSWKLVFNGDANFFNAQGFYDNYLAVSPYNPNLVLAGGIDIFRATDGAKFFNQTNGYSGGNVHVDQHCAAFSPLDDKSIYAGNDGGVYRSMDNGATWYEKNNGLEVTQFYALCIDNSKENRTYGGAQDNGTLGDLALPKWGSIYGGDGFQVVVNQNKPNIVLGEVYNGGLWRVDINDLYHPKRSFDGLPSSTQEPGLWNSPIKSDPNDPSIVYHGRKNLYVSLDFGNSWYNLGQLSTQADAKISTMAVSHGNSDMAYAGNDKGEVFVTKDFFQHTKEVSENGLVSRFVTDIETSPFDEETAYVSFSGYTSQNIFKTTDAGDSWTNIGAGLPEVPVNAIAIHPQNKDYIFAATDVGVFATFNGGATWYPFGRGMPRSPVLDLQFRENLLDYPKVILRAATHGRSMWEIEVPNEEITDEAITSPAGGEIYVGGTSQNISFHGFEMPVRIEYSLDDGENWVTVADNVESSSAMWTVPDRDTYKARIKVTSENNTKNTDQTSTFTIQRKKKGSILYENGVTFVPYGIAWDGKHGLYTTSFYANKLYKLNSETFQLERKIDLPGDSLFTDLTIDRDKGIIYLHRMNNTEGGGGKIVVIDTNGNKLREMATPGNVYPIGIELVDGKLLVGDRDKTYNGKRMLWYINPDNGQILQQFNNPFNKNYGPRGLCYDGSQYIYQICTFFPSSGQALTESLAMKMDKSNPGSEVESMPLYGLNGIINARGVDYDPRDKNYWLTDFGGNLYKIAGFDTKTGVRESSPLAVTAPIDAKVYPNPAVDFSTVSFNSSQSGFLKISVINTLGQIVGTFFDKKITAGNADYVHLNTETLPSGVYHVIFSLNGKNVLVKNLAVMN